MNRGPVMVFAGEFWSGSTGLGLARGFRDCGWSVQDIDFGHYQSSRGVNLIGKLLRRLGRASAIDLYRQEILHTCDTLRPDVFISIKGYGLKVDTLREIKRMGATTVNFYPDLHFSHPGILEDSFSEYDIFVTTKSFHLDYLSDLIGSDKVHYVPHGYDSCVHKPIFSDVQNGDYIFDVAYMGNRSTYKQKWIESLLSRIPTLNLGIFGANWLTHISGSPTEQYYISDARFNLSYAKTIQLSKINLAIHYGPNDRGWEDLVSTRTFEIPACKGFMLHIDNDEVRELFTPGVEIDVFRTPEELEDKIHFYLGRPELRLAMIERAYDRCVSAYSLGSRAKDVLAAIGARRAF